MGEQNRVGVRQHLPFYRKLAFGTGHFLMVLAVAMWFSYSVVFFEKVLKIPASSTGTIILISQIFGAISTPFVGMWSDDCKCRYGRRKIFHLMGNVSVACSYFFIWYECLGCEDAEDPYKVLYYASFAAMYQFGAAVQIAQLSLIPELTSDKNTKVELNSIRYAFTIVGNLVIFVTFWVLLEKLDNAADASKLSPSDKMIFWRVNIASYPGLLTLAFVACSTGEGQIMALVVIALGVSVSIFFQIFIREDPNIRTPKRKWYWWLTNTQFYLVICGFVSSRMIYLLTQSYLPLYLLNTLKMDRTSIAKGPLIMFISSFLVTLVVKRFNKFIGDKMTYFIGLAIIWGALIWFWVKDPTDDSTSAFNWSRDSIYGAAVLLGAGSITCLVMSLTFVSYVVGKYTGSSAFVYGWLLFADRLSNGVVVKIIQDLNPSIPSELPAYYRSVLVYVPFGATALGVATLSTMLLLEWCHRKYLPLSAQALTPSIQYGHPDETDEGTPVLRPKPREPRSWFTCCKFDKGEPGPLTDLEASMTM